MSDATALIDGLVANATQYVPKDDRLVSCESFDYDEDLPPRKLIQINRCKSYAQGFLSLTGASGGTGKSSLSIVEELSLVTGRDLFLPDRPLLKCGRKRVWSMSLEDDKTEHRRRVIAAMRHYNIKREDMDGFYFVTYKRDSPISVAISGRDGFIVSPQVDDIKQIVRERGIEVMTVDPFVNTHDVAENDNSAMNRVADLWRSIAQECDVAVSLTHHIRKSNGLEVDVESLRGAVSLTAAARLVRTLSPMSTQEAESFGIHEDRRRFYFWCNPSGKPNITPPATSRIWYHMASVDLANGDDHWESDNVGVCERWKAPDSLDGVTGGDVEELARRIGQASDEYLLTHCRESYQAGDTWIGHLIAEILEVDVDDDKGVARIKKVIAEWTKHDVLRKVSIEDKSRKKRPCLTLGKRAKISGDEP